MHGDPRYTAVGGQDPVVKAESMRDCQGRLAGGLGFSMPASLKMEVGEPLFVPIPHWQANRLGDPLVRRRITAGVLSLRALDWLEHS